MAESKQISEFLRPRIAAGDFPSVVYLVGEKGKVAFSDALGRAVAEPETIPARMDTIYDVASLTKVLVTGLLWAKLIEKDKTYLTKTVSEFFPQFKSADKKNTTIRQLASHTSGFAAWKPFYLMAGGSAAADYVEKRKRVIELIAAEPLINAPETKVVYSDLNFLLLGFLLEEVYSERLDAAAEKEIFSPLTLERTFFNPPIELKLQIAASERGNMYEKQTCIENGYDAEKYPWRKDVIWGEVHDGNAHLFDGVAGHAGLFSDAIEVFKIAQQFLAKTSLVPETCRMFRTNFTPGLNEARSLAFQLAATPDSTASDALAKDSFGHLGFTGTSLWIEPETERIFILLTNRTHAHELPFVNINSTRREFHRLAVEALEKR